jgi:hypothetical protein
MSHKSRILSSFSDEAAGPPLFLPDLTVWYEHNRRMGSLPEKWADASLPEISRDLGLPIWIVAQPYGLEHPGIEVRSTEDDSGRTVEYACASGTLSARWIKGPDGSWWQTEYPIKASSDFAVALEIANARTYTPDAALVDRFVQEVGDDGLVALEIPSRPYADLLLEFVGMSEGIMILMEQPPEMAGMLSILEGKLQGLVADVAAMPGDIVFAHDNLDAQFVYPPVFQQHYAASYRATADALQKSNKPLLVHAGGPVNNLLKPLADAGVNGIQGISGPPQSDATLEQAREAVGPSITLWGGIPQDLALKTHDREDFDTVVTQTARQHREDGRVILGIADRVPADADIDRIAAIPGLIERSLSG